jgi:hypothetical protein
MQTCRQCGLSIGDRAAFCPVCGTLVDSERASFAIEPAPAQIELCALCHYPGHLIDVESFRLCERCRDDLEVLVDRKPHAAVSIAGVADKMTSLQTSDLRAFLAYALEHILPISAQTAQGFHEEVRRQQNEAENRFDSAHDHIAQARDLEKSDAPRAAMLYRQAIVEYLESSEDPLDSPFLSGVLQSVFDRLSLVLKRAGLPDEALEEIDCAASLGLLDEGCGTKAARAALGKRRESLRRGLAKAARDNG